MGPRAGAECRGPGTDPAGPCRCRREGAAVEPAEKRATERAREREHDAKGAMSDRQAYLQQYTVHRWTDRHFCVSLLCFLFWFDFLVSFFRFLFFISCFGVLFGIPFLVSLFGFLFQGFLFWSFFLVSFFGCLFWFPSPITHRSSHPRC